MKHGWLGLIYNLSGILLLATSLSSCTPGRHSPAMAPAAMARSMPAGSTDVATVPAATSAEPYVQYGIASWYGEPFHGRYTANGEVYDMFKLTAAHKSVPLGVHAIVTNLDTGRSVRVRINDRGPFVENRILDLSYGAAGRLGMIETGLARVKIRFLPETIPIPIFVVQAGSYADEDNAMRVREALAIQYPSVWITMTREDSQTFYRVWLGTFRSRSSAERTARQIQVIGYATKVMPLSEPLTQLKPAADKL